MQVPSDSVEGDADVSSALAWLAAASGDVERFYSRLVACQLTYREVTGRAGQLGQDPQLKDLGGDLPAAFLAQGQSLLGDRRSYDPALGSRTVPWIKQLGRHTTRLSQISGARDRAARMLSASSVDPGSALFELVMAANYAAKGFDVAFVKEAAGTSKSPDIELSTPLFQGVIPVEFKRLVQGKYEQDEQIRHRAIFRSVAAVIDEKEISVHIDVTYTTELEHVPETYLRDHLSKVLSSPLVMLGAYPWHDEFGFGEVRSAKLADVRDDIRTSSLYFGTKLARLLSGKVVRENGYNLAVGADPDFRDPRYIQAISYGSVVTWQCIAAGAIEKKARYVKGRLVEADQQLLNHGPGIVHMAMDMELKCASSDLRRARNSAVISDFRSLSKVMAIYLHYLVPRISEVNNWLIDETVDRFGIGDETPHSAIFAEASALADEEPAWTQDIPLPKG